MMWLTYCLLILIFIISSFVFLNVNGQIISPTNKTGIDYKYMFQPFFTANGTTYFDIDSADYLELQDFSIATWFKKDNIQAPSAGNLVNKGGFNSDEQGENMNYGIWMTITGTLSGGFENENGDDFTIDSQEKYNDGQWHYAVLVFNNASLQLDIDGKTINTMLTNDQIPESDNEQPLRIGANSLELDKFFKGDLDEIRIWDRALTQAELQDIYKNYQFNPKGQVIYMEFGGSGPTNLSKILEKQKDGIENESLKRIQYQAQTNTTLDTNKSTTKGTGAPSGSTILSGDTSPSKSTTNRTGAPSGSTILSGDTSPSKSTTNRTGAPSGSTILSGDTSPSKSTTKGTGAPSGSTVITDNALPIPNVPSTAGPSMTAPSTITR